MQLARLAHDRCQLCHKPAVFTFDAKWGRRTSLTFHHIVKKSQGGDDVPENGLIVCGSGTTGCHGDLEAGHPWARCAARAAMSAAQLAYVLAKKGEVWLAQHYPLRRPRHGQLRPVR